MDHATLRCPQALDRPIYTELRNNPYTKGVNDAHVPIVKPGFFRLLLALIVVIDHFSGIMLGRSAVFLFFVLSGFWIQTMWRERYRLCHQPYLTFIVSRYWRLAPMMFVATAMAIAVQIALLGMPLAALWSDGLVHTAGSHLFLVGYSHLKSQLVVPAWSLDVEMQFYLIAPLLIAILARFGIAAFVALGIALVAYDTYYDTAAAFAELGWFAAGMVAAAYGRRPPRRLAMGSAFAAIGLVLVVAAVNLPLLTDGDLNLANRQLNQVVALLGIPLALHTCFAADDSADREWGNVSYVVYLVHWPLLVWTRSMDPAH